MSHFDQNQAPVSYPPPPTSGYSSGPFVAPPPAGYPMKDGVDGYPQNNPPPPNFTPETKSRGDGFLKGCCAALCCCCMLDACF